MPNLIGGFEWEEVARGLKFSLATSERVYYYFKDQNRSGIQKDKLYKYLEKYHDGIRIPNWLSLTNKVVDNSSLLKEKLLLPNFKISAKMWQDGPSGQNEA